MTVEILCRYDAGRQSPVVFLRDTIQGDKIQVWDGQGNPKMMPLDYYRMTAPLSADDERSLMERFKAATNRQDQVVRINHRMPRTSRPLPNVLAAPAQIKDINPAPSPATQRKTNAKPLDSQPLPQGPVGDLPQPGETLAPATPVAQVPTTQAAPASLNEPASVGMFRRVQELNARMNELATKIGSLEQEKQNATTDYEATKQACKELTAELERTLDEEAAEEVRKRKEMLAALSGNADPLAQAVQAMQDASTKAQETAQVTQTQAQAPNPQVKAQNAARAGSKASARPAAKSTARAGKK